jgi:hypothetical protein
MRKLLLAMVLVMAVAIPAFAQNGPLKIKLLMTYAENDADQATPIFFVGIGNYITLRTHWETKGTGSYTIKHEIRDSTGVLVYKMKVGPYDVDFPTFDYADGYTSFPIVLFERAGYYTLKSTYRDVATGNTWSHQTKIHVRE